MHNLCNCGIFHNQIVEFSKIITEHSTIKIVEYSKMIMEYSMVALYMPLCDIPT